jgi:hypothetical protein
MEYIDLTKSLQQNTTRETDSLLAVQKSIPFMEPEISLACSEKYAVRHCDIP